MACAAGAGVAAAAAAAMANAIKASGAIVEVDPEVFGDTRQGKRQPPAGRNG